MMGDESAAVKLDALIAEGRRLAVSTITVTEVDRGLDPDERAAFDGVISEMDVVPYGPDASKRAATVLRTLDERGDSIGSVDGMVAATALEHDGVVVTRNVSEFRRIDSLRVEPY